MCNCTYKYTFFNYLNSWVSKHLMNFQLGARALQRPDT